jgi:phosphatidate phosphatase APP1
MLNLLIALMGGSYERVEETSKLQTLKNRAQLILEYEKNMSQDQLKSDELHPRYLHVLVPRFSIDDEHNEKEAGVINGVKRMLKEQKEQDADMEQLKKDVSEMSAKMDAKMDAMQVDMTSKLEALLQAVKAPG